MVVLYANIGNKQKANNSSQPAEQASLLQADNVNIFSIGVGSSASGKTPRFTPHFLIASLLGLFDIQP